LIISRTVTSLPTFLAGLLLVDIAFEFGNSVGVTGQIFTVSRFVGIFASLIVGHLSLRYAHKRLLIVGLLFEIVSAIGCYLSQNFEILMIAYVMSSIGYAIIIPMSTTLVREYYQAEQTGDILGKIVAGSTVIGIIGGPFFGIVANMSGWRSTFPIFIIPFSLLSIIMVAKWLPDPAKRLSGEKPDSTITSFKTILKSRSAVACLIGWALANGVFSALVFYGPSFFREIHAMPTTTASLLQSTMTLSFTVGTLISGRILEKFGRKHIIFSSMSMVGIGIILYTNVANFWLSVLSIIVTYFLAGPFFIAANSMMLDQVPEFRSVMMSVSSSADQLGSAIGAGLGGIVLVLFSYGTVGIILGALSIVTALTFRLLTVDHH